MAEVLQLRSGPYIRLSEKAAMKIHEFQAKELLRAAGVPVLKGKVVHSLRQQQMHLSPW